MNASLETFAAPFLKLKYIYTLNIYTLTEWFNNSFSEEKNLKI